MTEILFKFAPGFRSKVPLERKSNQLDFAFMFDVDDFARQVSPQMSRLPLACGEV
ncbi:hypothetical protein [Rhizobium glycinendophyticum]|uniref:hypothetical protein n=1 Tax=Rhizobium glycinendophyticum TaxID=2589807 RepID=UPI001375564A|nr:hypothetical protein [Rhizobium glycinendophyticum]